MNTWKRIVCLQVVFFLTGAFTFAAGRGAGEELIRTANCPEGAAVFIHDSHRIIEIESPGAGTPIDVLTESPDVDNWESLHMKDPRSIRYREAQFLRDRLFAMEKPAFPGRERVVFRDLIRLRLFEDLQVDAVLTRVDQTDFSFTWVGRIRGDRESGDVNITFGRGMILGRVNISGKGLFRISQPESGKCLVEEMGPAEVEPAPPLIPDGEFAREDNQDPGAESETYGIIEVMVIWSKDAESEAKGEGSDVQVEIAQAVSMANTAYANSEVFQRIALVDSYRTEYYSSGDTSTDLYRLTGDDDSYMTEVHTRRYISRADFVALVAGSFSDGWAGSGWALEKGNSSFFKYYAFSVMSRSSLFYQTLAHELGHNMGAGHEVDNPSDPGPQYYSFSSGYHNSSKWYTIMSYSHGGQRIDHFSNPLVFYEGYQTGKPGVDGNDNAYTLDLNMSMVDNFGESLPMPTVGLPVLSSPGKGSTYSTSSPPTQLRWNCAADALHYDVWLEAGDYTPDVKVATGVETCYWNISPGIYNPGKYYWKVTASNDIDSKSSEIWYFNVDGPPVTPPEAELGEISLVEPAEESLLALSEEQVKLDWNDVDNALAYDLYIWSAGNAEPVSPYASNLSSSFLYVTIKIPDVYNWKVVARNNTESKTGPTWAFEIADPQVVDDMVIYFPHYIYGTNAATGLILINNCDTTQTGSIFYYQNSSTLQVGSVIKEEHFYLGAMDVAIHEWSGLPGESLKTGAIEVIQNGDDRCRVEGLEYFNALGTYTTVNRARPGHAQQIFANKSDTRDTGFAVYNPYDDPVEIEVTLLAGNDEMKSSLALAGKGHLAMYLGELFPGAPEDCVGTLNFVADSDKRFVMTGLLSIDDPPGLVALPTSPNAYDDGIPGSTFQAVNPEHPVGLEEEYGTQIMTFPQYIWGDGAGTELILINNCPSIKSGSILMYGLNGTIPQDEDVTAVPFSIDPMGVSVEKWYGNIGDVTVTGAVAIAQEGNTACSVEGVEFFNALGSYTTVGSSVLRDSHQIFGLHDENQDTGFALFNPNDHGIDIQVSFENMPYFSLDTVIHLEAKEHRAMFLKELFFGDVHRIKGIPGILDFLGMDDEPFGLVGLFLIDSASNSMVSLPSIPRAD